MKPEKRPTFEGRMGRRSWRNANKFMRLELRIARTMVVARERWFLRVPCNRCICVRCVRCIPCLRAKEGLTVAFISTRFCPKRKKRKWLIKNRSSSQPKMEHDISPLRHTVLLAAVSQRLMTESSRFAWWESRPTFLGFGIQRAFILLAQPSLRKLLTFVVGAQGSLLSITLEQIEKWRIDHSSTTSKWRMKIRNSFFLIIKPQASQYQLIFLLLFSSCNESVCSLYEGPNHAKMVIHGGVRGGGGGHVVQSIRDPQHQPTLSCDVSSRTRWKRTVLFSCWV